LTSEEKITVSYPVAYSMHIVIMWRIIILCTTITSLAADDKVSYENYKVFSILPTTKLHLEILQELRVIYEVSKPFK